LIGFGLNTKRELLDDLHFVQPDEQMDRWTSYELIVPGKELQPDCDLSATNYSEYGLKIYGGNNHGLNMNIELKTDEIEVY